MARAPAQIKKTKEPVVILDILLRDNVLYFVLENTGDSAVHDVRVVFRRKVMGRGGQVDVTKLPFWATLSFMPPHRRIEMPIDRTETFFTQNATGPLGVSITYSDASATWRGQIRLDFESYRDFPELRIRRD